ncbi:MAG: hypothetical protein AAF438_06805 [Pseudomonadota bacterium]
MKPRQAAQRMIKAMEKAAKDTWSELESNFPEEEREQTRKLVWEHVKTRFMK